jgi:phosphoglycerate dehydrogenase-like enzyme
MKLLIHPAIDCERLAAVVAAAGAMQVVNAESLDDLMLHMRDTDAFFGKLTAHALGVERQLVWVQAPTASLEHYLFPALIRHRCTLTNMRGLFSDVIADQVLGYILCFARNLHRYIRQQQQKLWQPIGGENERASFEFGPGVVNAIDRAHLHLADMTVGIVGLGAIGSEIARRAKAFSMRVLAVDPERRSHEAVEAIWPVEQLPELLQQSDFVIIAAPHTPQTAKLFRRPQFQAMKTTAYLINIGRGAIVDLPDLVAALQANEIAGAALDVYETEPLPTESKLWDMGDRVILTPHVAGSSPKIAQRHLELLLENVRRFSRAEQLLNVVDKAKWC